MAPFQPVLCIVVTASVLIRTTRAIDLLPFGSAKPNEQSDFIGDFDIITVPLTVALPFFGTTYNTVYLIDAGRISFIFEGDHFADPFPDNRPIIAPLWNDILATSEPLYWRQTTTDGSDLVAATNYVKRIYADFNTFEATWAMVVTWHKFLRFGSNEGFENTFQAVLATDGTLSFAIFLYQDVVDVTPTTVGVNAGDGINYSWLCISRTSAITELEQQTMTVCDVSNNGLAVFRMDSNNPNQASYSCTPIYSDCVVSYFCQENADDSALIDVVTIVQRPGLRGVMSWDTQKYENGENPNPPDGDCRTPDGASTPMTLSFTVDVTAATPKCGVRVTGTGVKTLEITIRTYFDDERLDVQDDLILQFTCTSDTVLPRTQTQMVMFSDFEITAIPPSMVTAELQVIAPGTNEVLTTVQVGQSLALRIVFDNMANNIPPYGVYVIDCSVGDTAMFDAIVVEIIQDGCVVKPDPTESWYMSRSFRQKSLTGGLFITDSGIMAATKFTHSDIIHFRCTVNVCFFQTSPPNLCDDSCFGTGIVRRRRSENQTSSVPETLVTRVKVLQPDEPRTPNDIGAGCIRDTVAYISFSSFGVGIFVSLTVTIVLFRKVIIKMNKNTT